MSLYEHPDGVLVESPPVYEHPQYVYVYVLVGGERFYLRWETQPWRSDPLAGFKDRLRDDTCRLYSTQGGEDIWIRPTAIAAWWRITR